MTRRWPVFAALVGCGLLVVAGGFQLVRGEDRQPIGEYSRVVVVGVPGLDWRDVTSTGTPRLYELAEVSDLGLLAARGASSFACPKDGWVTLGAGNRAIYRATDDCPAQYEPPPSTDAEVVAANDAEDFGTDPGLLGRQVQCVRTYGSDAELAALGADDVRPTQFGGLRGPAQLRASWADCPLALVAGPSLLGGAREATLKRVDSMVGTVARAAAQDDDTLLLVVGIADLKARPTMHVAMASRGSDSGGLQAEHGGVLLSASTGRTPYVQLIDVAPTALAALGIDAPSAMAGRAMESSPTDDDSQEVIDRLVDDAGAASVRYSAAVWLVWVWVVLTALYLLVGAGLVASSRWRRWQRPLTMAGVGVASIPAATGLANLVPWWEADLHRLAWGLALAGSVIVLSAVALAGPWRRHPFGPAVVVAAAGFGVFALDVVTGSHLQLNGLLGYTPIVASRFTGFGNMPFAVYAAGGLVCLAAAMHGQDIRNARWLAVVGGGTLVLLDGTPGLGSDFGGVLALVPAIVILTLVATGARVSVPRVIASLAAGLAVVTALAVVDYQRSAGDQTHLGRFVGQVLDGTAWDVVMRKASANLHVLLHSPVAVLTVALLVALVWLFHGSDSAGRQLLSRSGRSLKAAMAGVGVMAVVGSLLNDSGIAVLAAAGASTVPLLIAAATTVSAPSTKAAQPSDLRLSAASRSERRSNGAATSSGDPPTTAD
ncbi:MAG: hypothetical protein ACRDP2_05985 [Nocardioidaceae bacterium]